jgi:predicted TIM-barrel fold metal-dependent hydrolase
MTPDRLPALVDPTDARLLTRCLEPLLAELPGLSFFDAHTHTGFNDPDGARCSAEQLIALLAPLDARAVVFSTQEPDGYREANDRILSESAASEGRLVAFCRLNPNDDPVAEASRCVERGARGIKLHPRAEAFALDAPAVHEIFAFAHEHQLPVLIHAGRGIPALGRHTLGLASEAPGARIILAHSAVSDISWIWRYLPDHPNIFIDTAWWNPVDLIAMFAYAPPGRVLFASDAPYGVPAMNAILTLRCALQVGLSAEQIRAVSGGQLERLLAGQVALDTGPAPGPPRAPTDLILDRVFAYAIVALGRMIAGAPADEMVAFARLACVVDDDAPQAETCRAMAALIDLHEQATRGVDRAELSSPTPQRLLALGPLLLAATLAATPRVPVPEFVVV